MWTSVTTPFKTVFASENISGLLIVAPNDYAIAAISNHRGHPLGFRLNSLRHSHFCPLTKNFSKSFVIFP